MSDDDKEDGLTTGSLSDRPENSAIKQASPKEGLSTGSLFDRNREKVAEQYAPALSGKEGALAQFDAVTELMRNQIEEYESGKVVSSTGDTSLKGFGQFLTLSSKKPQGRGRGVFDDPEPNFYRPGFWVYPGSEGEVIVHPSVISGMSAASAIPDGVGEEVSVGGDGSIIAISIEAEPTSSNIGTIGDPNYVIDDGGGIIQGSGEIVTFASLAAMNTASVVALINNSDGSVIQNGVYHLPLAMMEAGSPLQVGHIGPIGVRMCAAGSLVVNSPTLQIIMIDENGFIVNPYEV